MVGDFLRRRKPEASSGHPSEGAALLPNGASSADDDSKMVPAWAEPLLCGSKAAQRQCLGGECELLHMPANFMARPCRAPREGRGKVVVCAGPERSGSTWLFNAVRLILQVSSAGSGGGPRAAGETAGAAEDAPATLWAKAILVVRL